MKTRGERNFKRKNSLTGYRLHDARLALTAGAESSLGEETKLNSAIRTIKYPLHASLDQINDTFGKIRNDYLMLIGPISYTDWLAAKKNPVYSAIDFWLDALALGGIFAGSDAELKKRTAEIAGGSPAAAFRDRYQSQIVALNCDWLDWEETYSFFEGDIRATPAKCFREELRKSGASGDPAIKEKIKQIITDYEYCRANFEEDPHYKSSKSKKDLLRQFRLNKLFGIATEELDTEAPHDGSAAPNNSLNLTFVFIPSCLLQPMQAPSNDCLVGSYVKSLGRNTAAELACRMIGLRAEKIIGETAPDRKLENLCKSLAGLDQNFNGFSNFYNLFIQRLKEDPVSCATEMLHRFPIHLHDMISDEMHSKCTLLADLAKMLPEPELTKDISQYRSFLGGALKSWYENRQNHLQTLQTILTRLEESLIQRKKEVEDIEILDDQENLLKLAHELIQSDTKCLDLISQVNQLRSQSRDFVPEYNLLSELFAESQTLANQFNQKAGAYHQEMSQRGKLLSAPLKNKNKGRGTVEARKRKGTEQDQILTEFKEKRLRKYPAFLGETKLSSYLKFRHAPALFTKLISIMQEISKVAQQANFAKDTIIHPASLEVLYRWVGETVAYGSIEEKQIKSVEAPNPMSDFLKLRWAQKKGLKYFYSNPYSKDRRKPVLSDEEVRNWLKDRPSFNSRAVCNWLESQILETLTKTQSGAREWLPYLRALLRLWPNLLRELLSEEALESLRHQLTVFLASAVKENEISKIFPSLAGFLRLIANDSPTERQANNRRLLNRVFSELSGLLALVSYDTFISRYSLQEQSDAQLGPILQDQASTKKKFHLELKGARQFDDPGAMQLFPVCSGKDQKEGSTDVQVKPKGAIFAIRSSKYQIQFINWLINPPENRRCSTENKGSFLIGEIDVIVRPDWQLGEIVLEDKLLSPTPRLYASIPFELTVEKKLEIERENSFLRSYTKRKARAGDVSRSQSGSVIGVDIGEYGLAFTVVDWTFNKNKLKALVRETPTRLLLEGSHRVLKDEVARLKKRQVKGTFGAPNTAVANLRETLVGAYRNKLHDLMIKYKAPIVYEYQVSAFEAGGNRIKKVYDSLKVADTGGKNDADRAKNRHYWGSTSNKVIMGQEIGAGLTSQMCTKCRRVATVTFKGLPESTQYEVEKISDLRGRYQWHKVRVNQLEYRAFLEQQDSIGSLGGALNFIRAAMRPPLKRFSRLLPGAAKKRRGNSSIFWCPFLDCNHLSDCDVQASYVIALKHLISRFWPDEKNEQGWLGIFADTEKVELEPVPLVKKHFRNSDDKSQNPDWLKKAR